MFCLSICFTTTWQYFYKAHNTVQGMLQIPHSYSSGNISEVEVNLHSHSKPYTVKRRLNHSRTAGT